MCESGLLQAGTAPARCTGMAERALEINGKRADGLE